MKPGVTLSDSKGKSRIKKLEETRLNLEISILFALDKITCINHEIKILEGEI